jgi:hypothetical protein
MHDLLKHGNVHSIPMHLESNFFLKPSHVESGEELEEAISEAELHGHFVGGARLHSAVGWHYFGLCEDASRFFQAYDRRDFYRAYTHALQRRRVYTPTLQHWEGPFRQGGRGGG